MNNDNYNLDEDMTRFGAFTGCVYWVWLPVVIIGGILWLIYG